MTKTEEAIIKKFNDFSRTGIMQDDPFVPIDLGNGITEVDTDIYEAVIESKEDPYGIGYSGPRIQTGLQFNEGREFFAFANCVLKYDEKQVAIAKELAKRLEEIGVNLIAEETDAGMYLGCGIGAVFENEEEAEGFVKLLDDKEQMSQIFYIYVIWPCHKMMDYLCTLDAIFSEDKTIDQAVDEIKKSMESEQ